MTMAAGTTGRTSEACARTGYLFHELFFWHDPGNLGCFEEVIQPAQHWEHAETKRRFHGLLSVSGLLDHLHILKPRMATVEEIERVHSRAYIERVQRLSADGTQGWHCVGHEATMSPGGYQIAALAAGGAIVALEAVLSGDVTSAYALVRPPGHHAVRDQGMGFCIFNNIAIAAAHALAVHGLQRIAIIDYDVHHGNGTQNTFESSKEVFFISIHQDNNYPIGSGHLSERGKDEGHGFTLNIPLPPGSGSGAYRAAFDRVVIPALDGFKPQLILVSSGFDAAFLDPLATMMLSSSDYRYIIEKLQQVAERHCNGKILCLHEGGYSEVYVPFCGLAVMEQLSGIRTNVVDPFLEEVSRWGYQDLQPHQNLLIDQAARYLSTQD